MSDAETAAVYWKDDSWSDLLTERDIHIPADILQCRAVSREFQFSSVEEMQVRPRRVGRTALYRRALCRRRPRRAEPSRWRPDDGLEVIRVPWGRCPAPVPAPCSLCAVSWHAGPTKVQNQNSPACRKKVKG